MLGSYASYCAYFHIRKQRLPAPGVLTYYILCDTSHALKSHRVQESLGALHSTKTPTVLNLDLSDRFATYLVHLIILITGNAYQLLFFINLERLNIISLKCPYPCGFPM